MWQMKTEIIPVVVGALGVIKKGSEKLFREIPGNINLWEIQKTTLLGTARSMDGLLANSWPTVLSIVLAICRSTDGRLLVICR